MASGNLSPVVMQLADDSATAQAGCDIALALTRGAVVFLKGDLGAGKTALARAMIRTLMQDENAEVPSPTFSLVQHYDLPPGSRVKEVLHADLYRISDESEVRELGLDDQGAGSLLLVEWPQNAEAELPPPDLVLGLSAEFGPDGRESRTLTISGREELINPVRRSLDIRRFLTDVWQGHVSRRFLQGDASSRSYEMARVGKITRILMNAPRQTDGPIIRDNKPYSRIAHLAEDVSAFVGVQKILDQLGMRVPEIHGQDLEKGLLLTEHLGTGQIITLQRKPIGERYVAAAQMLADLHQKPVVREAETGDGKFHIIPDYDRVAMAIETELLTDWYAPSKKGAPLGGDELGSFKGLWNRLFDQLEDSERHIVLRDFHSPNIIWQSNESGSRRIGLIDFQDAVIGPVAYDVASLAQDARVDINQELETRIVEAYIQARSATGEFDADRFRLDYAIMAAQRATKILGIFVRLNERDGKPAYLAHLPRMHDYIARSLKHPALKTYADWFERIISKAGAGVTKT